MTQAAIEKILDHFRRKDALGEGVVFIADTSFVVSDRAEDFIDAFRNRRYLDFREEMKKEAEHVRKVTVLFQEHQAAVVPIEVRQEVNETIHVFHRYDQITRRNNINPRQKPSGIPEYVAALRTFQDASVGKDPRFCESLGHIRGIEGESPVFASTRNHFYHEVYRRHLAKGKDIGLADIPIHTLAYLIQKQGLLTCVLTRDKDFATIARNTRANIEEHQIEMRQATLIHFQGLSYELFIYQAQ